MKKHKKSLSHSVSLTVFTLCTSGLTSTSIAQQDPPPQKVEVRAIKTEPNDPRKINLTGEELQHLPGGGGDPLKAAQILPGLAMPDDGSGAVAVRGARPTDNAYYVDNLPVGYLFHMGGFLSVFNADLIRRFDLYSAAWSPQYGDVVGGVFNISMRQPKSGSIGGKVSAGIFFLVYCLKLLSPKIPPS